MFPHGWITSLGAFPQEKTCRAKRADSCACTYAPGTLHAPSHRGCPAQSPSTRSSRGEKERSGGGIQSLALGVEMEPGCGLGCKF